MPAASFSTATAGAQPKGDEATAIPFLKRFTVVLAGKRRDPGVETAGIRRISDEHRFVASGFRVRGLRPRPGMTKRGEDEATIRCGRRRCGIRGTLHAVPATRSRVVGARLRGGRWGWRHLVLEPLSGCAL